MGGRLMKARAKSERKEERTSRLHQFRANIRTRHLILILIPLAFATATFLRFDHLKMTNLKQAVLDADQAGEVEGDDGTITESPLTQEEIDANLKKTIAELKDYTESNIIVNFMDKNGGTELIFGTGPIYLEHQYNRKATRAIREAEEKINAAGADGWENANGNVFAQAMAVCKPQAIYYGWAWNSPGYLACMTGEINKYPTTDSLTSSIMADIPSTAIFRYDFVSPVWAPTAAGWFMLFCAILIIIIVIRIISWIIIRVALLVVR